MVNALLLKFKTTIKVISHDRLIFGFSGKSPIAAYIKIFSPDAPEYSGEYFLTFK